MSHTRTVPSVDPEAKIGRSRENATAVITLACPCRVAVFSRFSRSHTWTLKGPALYSPMTRVLPSGERIAESTAPSPERLAIRCAVRTSHTSITLHDPPTAKGRPSAVNPTDTTRSAGISKRVVFPPVSTSHTLTVPSEDPETRSLPSGEKAREPI